jgi:hypothetical protein
VKWCEADLPASSVNTAMNSEFHKGQKIYCIANLICVVRVCQEAYSMVFDYFTFLVIKGKVVSVLNALSTTPRRHMGEWMYSSIFS